MLGCYFPSGAVLASELLPLVRRAPCSLRWHPADMEALLNSTLGAHNTNTSDSVILARSFKIEATTNTRVANGSVVHPYGGAASMDTGGQFQDLETPQIVLCSLIEPQCF